MATCCLNSIILHDDVVLQGSLIFVCGKTEGLMMVSGRRHNSDDLVATALAVEPIKTVYRGR